MKLNFQFAIAFSVLWCVTALPLSNQTFDAVTIPTKNGGAADIQSAPQKERDLESEELPSTDVSCASCMKQRDNYLSVSRPNRKSKKNIESGQSWLKRLKRKAGSDGGVFAYALPPHDGVKAVESGTGIVEAEMQRANKREVEVKENDTTNGFITVDKREVEVEEKDTTSGFITVDKRVEINGGKSKFVKDGNVDVQTQRKESGWNAKGKKGKRQVDGGRFDKDRPGDLENKERANDHHGDGQKRGTGSGNEEKVGSKVRVASWDCSG